jgi:hypothetical protein
MLNNLLAAWYRPRCYNNVSAQILPSRIVFLEPADKSGQRSYGKTESGKDITLSFARRNVALVMRTLLRRHESFA